MYQLAVDPLAGRGLPENRATVYPQIVHGVFHMASWREINDIAKDPVRMRGLAEHLLAVFREQLTEWELNFLQSLLVRGAADETLTTRQAEKLVEIRDDLQKFPTFRGYSVKNLMPKCWIGRLDLDEPDKEFIERMCDAFSLNRRDWYHLLSCARQLFLVDSDGEFA